MKWRRIPPRDAEVHSRDALVAGSVESIAARDATGDTDYVRDRWDAICRFYETHRADRNAYLGGISAPLAMARLACVVGDDTQQRRFEREAVDALRNVQNEPQMREPMFRRYGFDPKWHGPFNFQGFHLLGITPEVARCIRDQPGVRQDLLSRVEGATLHWPMWFISQASAFTRYYRESHALSPLYSGMIFPVRALVEQAPAEQLRIWVDAEDAPRGDQFFIERLVLAIEAEGDAQWIDVRS